MKIKRSKNQWGKDYHVAWYIIAYKFSFGLIELLFGLGMVLFGQQALQLYQRLAAEELSEEPHDVVIAITSRIVPGILTHNTFLVVYLILLGSVKIAGSVGLIYKKNWGVDLLVILTIILFPFQIVNLLLHPNMFDFLYITVGLIIAFYLIEFNPKAWISRMLMHIDTLKNV